MAKRRDLVNDQLSRMAARKERSRRIISGKAKSVESQYSQGKYKRVKRN